MSHLTYNIFYRVSHIALDRGVRDFLLGWFEDRVNLTSGI